MYRAVLITIVVVVAYLATSCSGQVVVEPDLNCDQSKVGLTYPLDSPLYYYTCRDANTPMIFPCQQGKGYINNGTLEGCLWWSLWDCTYKGGPPACDASQQASRFPDTQPTLSWICQGINNPQTVACPDGSAYVPNGSNVGCKPWAEWTTYCPY